MFFDLSPLRLIWAALALAGLIAVLLGAAAPPRGADWAGVAALALWCGTETMMRRNWLALVTFPALALGLGVALPLYLLLRSARIE